jgi:hypothetical protein
MVNCRQIVTMGKTDFSELASAELTLVGLA